MEKGASRYVSGVQSLQTAPDTTGIRVHAGRPEVACQLDEFFRARGVRDAVELSMMIPGARPIPNPDVSDLLEARLAGHGVELLAGRPIESVDAVGRRVLVPFEARGACYADLGGGEVARLDADFLGGETPRMTVEGPSDELAGDRERFASVRRERWFRDSSVG